MFERPGRGLPCGSGYAAGTGGPAISRVARPGRNPREQGAASSVPGASSRLARPLPPAAGTRLRRVAERVLTERELNRALLPASCCSSGARGRSRRRSSGWVACRPSTRRRCTSGCGRGSTGFERDALTRALERGSVVQGTLLRSTIHLVSKSDYWPWALAVRDARRESWSRTPWRKEVSTRQLAAVARSVAQALRRAGVQPGRARRGARGAQAQGERLAQRDDALARPGAGCRRRAPGSAGAPTATRSPPTGSGPRRGPRTEGVELLVRRYLGGFGPSSTAEIASWAGLPRKRVESATGDDEAAHVRGRGRHRAARPARGRRCPTPRRRRR